MERRRKSAEELCHREIDLAIAVVHRWIEEHRRAVWQEGDVAVPEVAVDKRCRRRVAIQQVADTCDVDAIPVAPRELKLRLQPLLAPERLPVARLRIALRRRADVAVALPSVACPMEMVDVGEHAPQC